MSQATLLIALAALLVGSIAHSADAPPDLLAAAGRIEITPTSPVFMAGYGWNRRSEGAHDPLWARCLVLKSGTETIALVSCDVLGVTRSRAQYIRRLIRYVPRERVLIGATHTHSGPDTYGMWGPTPWQSGVDAAWMERFCGSTARLVDDTAAALKPARLSFAATSETGGASRNTRVPRILDPEMAVMQVTDLDGKTIAALVNFACHPEILNNHRLTSDFPNWLRARVEAKLGGVAIYMNGAQGGMVTAAVENEERYPKGEAWPEAERIGDLLGDAAVAALADAKTAAAPSIRFDRRELRVRLANDRFRALIKAGVLPRDFVERGAIETEVTRFTIGPAEFVTFPGEVLPNIGLFLKSRMTGSPKFQLGLTGDALGYILTREDYPLALYHYESSVSVGPEIGPKMTDALLAMMRSGTSANRPATNDRR